VWGEIANEPGSHVRSDGCPLRTRGAPLTRATSAPAHAVRPHRPGAWTWFLLLGLAATAVAVAIAGTAGSYVSDGVRLAGAVAVLVGVCRYAPASAGAWRLIALGFVLATASAGVLDFEPGLRARVPVALTVGGLFLAKQLLLIVGLIRLVPRDPDRRWSDATLDGIIIATGTAVGLWTFVGRPLIHTARFGELTIGAALTFAAMDVLIVGVLARFLFAAGRPVRASALFVAGIGALLAGDGGYCVTLTGAHPFRPSSGSLVCWLAAAVLVGAAALHPGLSEVGRPSPTAGTSTARVITFVVLAVVDPVIGAAVELFSHRHLAAHPWTDNLVPALLLMALSVLLVLRLALLLRTVNSRAQALAGALRMQEELQERLTQRALHDPLTGLGNRALLADRLTAAAGQPYALLMLDLDGFKDINDTLGHPAGDELLVEVAARLRAAAPDGAVVRLGGDEFAILAPGADPAGATGLAQAVLAAVRAPYLVAGRQLYLTTSIGVVPANGRRNGPGDALRDGDLALYAAKAAGKNQIVVFDATLRRARTERARVATGLRRALADNGLSMQYQPIVDLQTGRVRAVEALLRWSPAGHGPISPSEFVPVAEETGLIVPIGGWALERALRQGRGWYERHQVAISVNVSALQLSAPDFADRVLDALDSNGIPGAGLMLELTESVLITQATGDDFGVNRCLNRLRRHGIRIAVDDFGTGYSSLSYLWQLPVDVLKIDRMFIGYLSAPEHSESRRTAFLRAILDVGRSLNLQTVAEGVETPAEERRLREMGCRYVQGFLFSPPLPALAVSEYLNRPLRAVAA
jgi:diguanylate cyclase (GGDEF)-like protein